MVIHQSHKPIFEREGVNELFLKNKKLLLILNYRKAIMHNVTRICTYLMKILLNNVFTHMIQISAVF